MVAESLQVSLRNLQTTYLDSWVMHSPLSMVEEIMVAYRVMEQAVDDGKVKRLGISNCYSLDWLSSIYDTVHIKPSVLQNAFTAKCSGTRIYGSSVKHMILVSILLDIDCQHSGSAFRRSENLGSTKQLTPQTLMYAYIMQLGYGRPLDGTRTDMKQDIAVMQRLQNGKKIFEDEADIRRF